MSIFLITLTWFSWRQSTTCNVTKADLKEHNIILMHPARSMEIVPRAGPPFWLMESLFGWWNLEADPLFGAVCWWILEAFTPFREGVPPLGTISMDLAVCTKLVIFQCESSCWILHMYCRNILHIKSHFGKSKYDSLESKNITIL